MHAPCRCTRHSQPALAQSSAQSSRTMTSTQVVPLFGCPCRLTSHDAMQCATLSCPGTSHRTAVDVTTTASRTRAHCRPREHRSCGDADSSASGSAKNEGRKHRIALAPFFVSPLAVPKRESSRPLFFRPYPTRGSTPWSASDTGATEKHCARVGSPNLRRRQAQGDPPHTKQRKCTRRAQVSSGARAYGTR